PVDGPLTARLCRKHVYVSSAECAAEFDLGHTWDGAPLPCAVGVAVLNYIVRHQLVDRVRDRGPELLAQLKAATKGIDIVGEVRGRGFLLGVSLVDPRDGSAFLPDELDAATLVDDIGFEHELLVSSTHSTPDRRADPGAHRCPPPLLRGPPARPSRSNHPPRPRAAAVLEGVPRHGKLA